MRWALPCTPGFNRFQLDPKGLRVYDASSRAPITASATWFTASSSISGYRGIARASVLALSDSTSVAVRTASEQGPNSWSAFG